ncbi:MAG: hypothetical protein U1F30_16475 [Steroidobacteraceae bacterium]
MDALLHALRSPPTLFLASFLALCLAAWVGARHLTRLRAHVAAAREDFDVILGATLTLLALIIGFTFSMALSRYDQRKNLEEAEANAIGTEYLRADLLPEADAGRVRALLRDYMAQRLAYYTTRDAATLAQVEARGPRGCSRNCGRRCGGAGGGRADAGDGAGRRRHERCPEFAGYTDAAWSNWIPAEAWFLLVVIAGCGVVLVGVRLPAAMGCC